MSFEYRKCSVDNIEIKGLYEIYPKVFGDTRGYFFESYSEKDFFEAGLTMKFVQDNQSKSSKNVLRGLHFQKEYPQGKLIRVLDGKIYDVVVDIRKNSGTYGKYFGLELTSEKQNMIYIPQGFAHGFLTLSETSIISYKCTDFYHPEDEDGIIWNDGTIGIDWNEYLQGESPLLSEKDRRLGTFSSIITGNTESA